MESPLHLNNRDLPSDKSSKKWTARRYFIILIIVFCIASVTRYWVRAYKVPSVSMEPTIQKDDQIVAVRVFESQILKRGDIVIFPLPTDRKKDFVKRIVGLSGEKLEIRKQQVFINDQALEEPYAMHTEPPTPKPSPRDDFGPKMIPDDYVFVLGDNRENSLDSRQFGLIQIKDISRK